MLGYKAHGCCSMPSVAMKACLVVAGGWAGDEGRKAVQEIGEVEAARTKRLLAQWGVARSRRRKARGVGRALEH